MDNRKFLVTLFDGNGGDYEIVVLGTKSAKNFMDFIFDTKCEAMVRPYEEKRYSPIPEITEEDISNIFTVFK